MIPDGSCHCGAVTIMPDRSTKLGLSTLFGVTALVAAAADAAEKTYPSKPIPFVVPFTPGGSQGEIARIAGHHVVIDNRSGARAPAFR